MYVYLAGRMAGLTREQMNSWRKYAKEILEDAGFKVYNPVQTEFKSGNINRQIVHSNKFQIQHSDIVLAELDHEVASLGTISEIVFAGVLGKPVIVFGVNKKVITYPWVQEHTTVSFDYLGDALDYIKANYCKAGLA